MALQTKPHPYFQTHDLQHDLQNRGLPFSGRFTLKFRMRRFLSLLIETTVLAALVLVALTFSFGKNLWDSFTDSANPIAQLERCDDRCDHALRAGR